MPNRFYYYDHQTCSFVEATPSRREWLLKGLAVVSLAVVLAAVGVGVLSTVVATPAEVAQRDEIQALRQQLTQANTQLGTFSEELADLAETDRELYRTVLHADPTSAEAFEMGVGGAEDARFNRYATPTRDLLRETDRTMDRLSRQVEHQSRSYEQLRTLAGQRDATLRQHPAILPVRDGRLTSGFGMRFHPVLRVSRMHAGVDFAVPVGTPVYATGDGTVSFSGDKGGYGTVLEIDHPLAGKRTRYAHLLRPAAGIRTGSAVQRGQVVAYSGNSGLSTAPHLHYEVIKIDDGSPLDPVRTFVPGVTPAQYRDLVQAARQPTASLH